MNDQPEPKYALYPGDKIPENLLDVLATWPEFRNHPAWKDHPQVKEFLERPKFNGWDRRGEKVYPVPVTKKRNNG